MLCLWQLVCAKWHHSYHKRKFSTLTGWQNLSFPWLYSTSFIRSMAVIHEIDTQLLMGNSICYVVGVSSDMEQAVDHGWHLNKLKPFRKLSNEVCRNTFSKWTMNWELLFQQSMMQCVSGYNSRCTKLQLLQKVQENNLLWCFDFTADILSQMTATASIGCSSVMRLLFIPWVKSTAIIVWASQNSHGGRDMNVIDQNWTCDAD
jgi:hypothetical protein